ncbi:rod shape-determining protein MreC [Deferribacterales bacterium Es71-Z0220]|uniref:rod shape-determining protein MreC n=1 Tax=Deferrivibrio essentukiensis TaxID=2880922 RepID=UPI001F607408|nr:rod shape-determining protein MreC [Deferrivibrio essentukiensis]MCB4204670.1 rod shape-determining protein MreC [Deferrivibrio essentukiensis]
MVKKRYLFLILAFVSALIVVQIKNPKITGPFRGILGNILNPIVYTYYITSNSIGNLVNNYIFLVNVKKENELLKKELDNYKFEISILKEKLTDYERLKQLLEFKDAYNFDTVACNIIGKNLTNSLSYFIIDKGMKDNIKVNDTIVGHTGLVGKVDDVYINSSLVKVILDITNNVSVMNFETRTTGILKGDGKGGIFVDYYDKLEPVEINDLFITTGLGGVYPKGIPVGTVVKIENSESNLFQKIILKPLINFNKIENALIIKNVKK